MNRILLSFFILLLAACSASKKVSQTPAVPVVTAAPTVDTLQLEKDTVPPPAPASMEVKIGLLLPMQIKRHFDEDTVPDTNPLILPEALPALHFYEGALLAADSLSIGRCMVRFKIIDTGIDSLSTITKLNTTSLSDMDAVISLLPPVYSRNIAAASDRWKKPVYIFTAPNTQILEGHPYLYLVSPSNNTQIRLMAAYLSATYPASNFIAVYRDQRKEDDLAKLFQSVIDSAAGKAGTTALYNWKGGWSGLKSKLAKAKRNLLIVPTSDESFLSSLLNKMREEKDNYTFMLCGLPAWESFESIDPLVMKDFDATIFNGSFIDYKSTAVSSFRKRFIDSYHADPLPQAFWGYDLVLKIAVDENRKVNRLTLPDFMPTVEVNKDPKWQMAGEGAGFENRNINFLRFGDYDLVRLK